MFQNIKNAHQEGLLETVLKAGCLNLIIGAIALVLDSVLEIPPLPISKPMSFLIFFALIIIYAGLLTWSAFSLMKAKKNNQLTQKGPYSLCRHPMYVGIVLLVNPALAILFQSWALLEACLIFYFIWRHFAKKEEIRLIKVFGNEYRKYSKEVGCLFPRIC